MADDTNPPSEVAQRTAVEFAFGLHRYPWYTAERTTHGLTVTYRALSGLDFVTADEAAGVLIDPLAKARERAIQYTARAVVVVDGYELPADLAWRLDHFHGEPDSFRAKVTEGWAAVQQEYNDLLSSETAKNS